MKLVCRLLCLEDSSVAAGRALLIPAAIMHKAQKIEVKIDKKNERQKAFWMGLGFEIHDDVAEMLVDASLLGKPPPPSAPNPAPAPTAPNPAPPKKRTAKWEGRDEDDQQQPADRHSSFYRGAASTTSPSQPLPPRPLPHSAVPASSQQPMASAHPGYVPSGPATQRALSHPPSAPPPVPTPPSVRRLQGEVPAPPIPLVEDEAQEPPADVYADVYIRKTCPGYNEPHLVIMPQGHTLLPSEVPLWHLVPEHELRIGHTVQCLECKRVFDVVRDQADPLPAVVD